MSNKKCQVIKWKKEWKIANAILKLINFIVYTLSKI